MCVSGFPTLPRFLVRPSTFYCVKKDIYIYQNLQLFASKNPFVSDEQFQPPNIRNKPAREQQQQPINNANERTEKDSGTVKDVIITDVSTYAEAAKVSCNNQPNTPGTTFIGKRVNFNKTKPKQKQSNVQNQPATSQSSTNLRPPPHKTTSFKHPTLSAK